MFLFLAVVASTGGKGVLSPLFVVCRFHSVWTGKKPVRACVPRAALLIENFFGSGKVKYPPGFRRSGAPEIY